MLSHFRRSGRKAVVIAVVSSLLGMSVALAASGDLDTTFNGTGKQTTDFGSSWADEIHGMALSSGKVVAVGGRYDPSAPHSAAADFAVARYTSHGQLDSTFSGNGKLTTDFGGKDIAQDVAIQSNGRIVVSGRTCAAVTATPCDMALARYTTGGALDGTFNGTGKLVFSFGPHSGTSGGLAIQPDGKIVVAGWRENGSGDEDFAVYRFNPGGTPDTTFSGDGRKSFGFGAGRQDGAAALMLVGSKIVVAGQTCDSSWLNCNAAIARLNANGSFDSTFSLDGKATTNFGGTGDLINDLALQPDGKIMAVGERYTDTGNSIQLVRYRGNGTLDSTFSGDGKKYISLGTVSFGEDVVVQPDGKIVAAGTAAFASRDFVLVRLNPRGGLDSTFNGTGKVQVDFGGSNERAYAVVLQADGKYVVGGFTSGAQVDFALARVLP